MNINNNVNNGYITSANLRGPDAGKYDAMSKQTRIASDQSKIKDYKPNENTSFIPKVITWLRDNLCCCLSLETIQNEHETELCCFPKNNKGSKNKYDANEFKLSNRLIVDAGYSKVNGEVKSHLRPITDFRAMPERKTLQNTKTENIITESDKEKSLSTPTEKKHIPEALIKTDYRQDTAKTETQKTQDELKLSPGIQEEMTTTTEAKHKRTSMNNRREGSAETQLDNKWMKRRIEPNFVSTPSERHTDASALEAPKSAATQIQETTEKQNGKIKFTLTDAQKALVIENRDRRAEQEATRGATIEEQSKMTYESLVTELMTKLPPKIN